MHLLVLLMTRYDFFVGILSSPYVVAFSPAVLPVTLKFPSLGFLNFAEYALISG